MQNLKYYQIGMQLFPCGNMWLVPEYFLGVPKNDWLAQIGSRNIISHNPRRRCLWAGKHGMNKLMPIYTG